MQVLETAQDLPAPVFEDLWLDRFGFANVRLERSRGHELRNKNDFLANGPGTVQCDDVFVPQLLKDANLGQNLAHVLQWNESLRPAKCLPFC